jgi:activator of 2-hydroxyglutaryl-CoA dehydratase
LKTLGLCIGASNISMVLLEQGADGQIRILDTKTRPHEGNPRSTIAGLVDGKLLKDIHRLAVTGRKLRSKLNASSLSEPEAVEHAYRYLRDSGNEADMIISAGGETFIAYKLDREGRITGVYTGNKCASGTGEFFLQQSCWACNQRDRWK